MSITGRGRMGLAVAGLSALTMGQPLLAQTVVKLTLWDKGEAAMEGMEEMAPLGLAVPGADMAMATMGIGLDRAEVPAGPVKFVVVNDSQSFWHSVTISAVTEPAAALPYQDEARMVDEAAVGVVAKSKELGLHQNGSFTADLPAGRYILYCNIAGHYAMGMWALLTVTP